MTRRIFGAGLAAAALSPAAALAASKLPLNNISRYLNGLRTVKGAFTQINDDGSISTGRIFIKRPGRARFEYDPAPSSLVMVGGGTVAVFDAKSNLPPEQYPLKRTPLNLMLKRNVNLAQANMVVGHSFDGTTTSVTARDPKNPEIGTIRMVFSGPPIELRQWVITNQDGSTSTVILGDVESPGDLPASLFNIPFEIERRGL